MKRTIFRISLVMLLGVVTSVAVAWGCAWRAAYVPRRSSFDSTVLAPQGDRAWYLYTEEFAGVTWLARTGWPKPGGPYAKSPPWWSRRDYNEEPFTPHGMLDSEVAAGWPMFCIGSLVTADYRRGMEQWSYSGALGIDIADAGYSPAHVYKLNGAPILLPYSPILPGLLANTAIYGGVWWAMLFGPGMLIRWRRRCAGRCATCGYDLRGLSPVPGSASGRARDSVCPECGKVFASDGCE